MTGDWHYEFPTIISQVSIAYIVVDEGYFLIQTLQRILKTQNQHQAEFSALSGGRKSVPISWMCKKQTSVSHRAPQNQKSYRWMLVCVWMVLPALDFWDLVIEVLKTTHGMPKPTQASTLETSAETQSTPKIKQVLDQKCGSIERRSSSFERTYLCEGITVVHFRRQRSCDKNDHQMAEARR